MTTNPTAAPPTPKPLPDPAAVAARAGVAGRVECHPVCSLGPDADHPGYLGYRCVDEQMNTLPFPGEDHATTTATPATAHDERTAP